jgi:hypothetical protein
VLWFRALINLNRNIVTKKEKHREIYPLSLDQISKLSSFEQILGREKSDYKEEERKERWNKAMSFPGGKQAKEYFSNYDECADCNHCKNGWCAYAGLPCGVNPKLTYQYGMIGMACQGIGYEMVTGTQIELEFEKSDLPF